jgi:cytosine/adenosine deaminase-related metal-dependent hydrolase
MRLLIEAANTTIAVEDGTIVEPSGSFDHVIRAPHGEVRPGLINAHDHLHRNHYGRLGAPPYANAYEWARDIQDRNRAEIARGRELPRREALLFGAWKNLIAGVTHVCHHDPWEPDFETIFPLDVIRLPSADSLGMTHPLPSCQEGPFAMHVAEGVDAGAAEEIRELDRRGFLTPDFLAVHAVGAHEDGVETLRRSGCALIWCPSSNTFLFGRTAPRALLAEGIDVLLGTDSLLTADGTMLEEIRIARRDMSDARILDAVGSLAARRLGVTLPSLDIGTRADVVVSERPILESRLEDILLVMADGVVRVLEPALAAGIDPAGGRSLEAFGVRRWIGDSAL